MGIQQTFKLSAKKGRPPKPVTELPPVTSTTHLENTTEQFKNHLANEGKSLATIEAYAGDIRNFANCSYNGSKEISKISLHDLKTYIGYLTREAKEEPTCIARRISSLKKYFGWLYEDKILSENIASGLASHRAVAPLPDILSRTEIKRYLEEAAKEPRDYLLSLILLEAGPKRRELLEIEIADIDLTKDKPEIVVNRNDRNKRRLLVMPREFECVFNNYLKEYHPEDYQPTDRLLLFKEEKTLKKILQNIAGRAGIKKEVSAQLLRDTFGAVSVKEGRKPDEVLGLLGLSPSIYRDETVEKYVKLAQKLV